MAITRTQVPTGQRFSLAMLRAELTQDPQAAGYATLDDQAVAATLNLENVQVETLDLPSSTVVAALDPDEFATMTPAQVERLHALLSPGFVKIGDSWVRAMLDKMFPPVAFPVTRQALNDARVRRGSRGEYLFGENFVVTPQHVALARRGRVLPDGSMGTVGVEEVILATDHVLGKQGDRVAVPATWAFVRDASGQVTAEEYVDPADGLLKTRAPLPRASIRIG